MTASSSDFTIYFEQADTLLTNETNIKNRLHNNMTKLNGNQSIKFQIRWWCVRA